MSIKLLLLALFLAPQIDTITVQGHVVCAFEEAIPLAGEHEHECVFKTDDGELLPLFRSVTSEAVFVDTRLQERHLEVDAGLHANGLIEVYQIRSIIDGVLHDLHYWCDTCAIRAESPGPCWCCYQPFEFRETPMGPVGSIRGG